MSLFKKALHTNSESAPDDRSLTMNSMAAPAMALGQRLDDLRQYGAFKVIREAERTERDRPGEQSWHLECVHRWGIEGSGFITTDAEGSLKFLLWSSELAANSLEDITRQNSVSLEDFGTLKQRLELAYGPATRDDVSTDTSFEYAWLNDGVKRTLGMDIDDLNNINFLTYSEMYWSRPSLALE